MLVVSSVLSELVVVESEVVFDLSVSVVLSVVLSAVEFVDELELLSLLSDDESFTSSLLFEPVLSPVVVESFDCVLLSDESSSVLSLVLSSVLSAVSSLTYTVLFFSGTAFFYSFIPYSIISFSDGSEITM